ncbi:MAG: hypothetical protein M3Y40_08290 [Chloroflexota bacterium]|nr:hypothetical protein [Chloroflexota bacterium]
MSPPSASAATSELPERADEAADLLDCQGPLSDMGGFANDFGADAGGDTPDDAFAAWIAANPFPIPRSGYRALGSLGDRWVYVYETDEGTKVVVVISPRFAGQVGTAFTVEEMRTCVPSEYGAGVDLGPDRRAWVHEETGALLTDIAGPGHCGWESARMLHVEDEQGRLVAQYVRDPQGVFADVGLLEAYAEGVELPEDASDSGYRTDDGQELWFTESDRAAYIVTPDGVERWPRAREPIGCA